MAGNQVTTKRRFSTCVLTRLIRQPALSYVVSHQRKINHLGIRPLAGAGQNRPALAPRLAALRDVDQCDRVDFRLQDVPAYAVRQTGTVNVDATVRPLRADGCRARARLRCWQPYCVRTGSPTA